MFEDAKYTLLMKIIKTEPGYTYFQNEESPSISVKIVFIETNDPENKLAKIAIPLCRGVYGSRLVDKIKLAYTRCGFELGAFLIEKTFTK